MPFPERKDKKFGEILIELGYVSPVQIHRLLKMQDEMKETRGYKMRLGDLLLRERLVNEENLARAMAEQCGMEFMDLEGREVELGTYSPLPRKMLEEHAFILLMEGGGYLVAVEEEPSREFYDSLCEALDSDVTFVSSPRTQVLSLMDMIRNKILQEGLTRGRVGLSCGEEPSPLSSPAPGADQPAPGEAMESAGAMQDTGGPATHPSDLLFTDTAAEGEAGGVPAGHTETPSPVETLDALQGPPADPGVEAAPGAKPAFQSVQKFDFDPGEDEVPDLEELRKKEELARLSSMDEEAFEAALSSGDALDEIIPRIKGGSAADRQQVAAAEADRESGEAASGDLDRDPTVDLEPDGVSGPAPAAVDYEREAESWRDFPLQDDSAAETADEQGDGHSQPEPREPESTPDAGGPAPRSGTERMTPPPDTVEGGLLQSPQAPPSSLADTPSSTGNLMRSLLSMARDEGITMLDVTLCPREPHYLMARHPDGTYRKYRRLEKLEYELLLSFLSRVTDTDLKALNSPLSRKVKLKTQRGDSLCFRVRAVPCSPPLINIRLCEDEDNRKVEFPRWIRRELEEVLSHGDGVVVLSAFSRKHALPMCEALCSLATGMHKKVILLDARRYEEAEDSQGAAVPTDTLHRFFVGAFCEHRSPEETMDVLVRTGCDLIAASLEPAPEQIRMFCHLGAAGPLTSFFMPAASAMEAFLGTRKAGVSTAALVETIRYILFMHPVSTLCPYCRETYILAPQSIPAGHPELKNLGNMKIYRGRGCKVCRSTGKGEDSFVFERIRIEPGSIDIEKLSREKKTLYSHLNSTGMLRSLQSEARAQLLRGMIDIKEYSAILESLRKK